MAAEVTELDLIVGGHSHSFLFTGEKLPSIEKPEGIYQMQIHLLRFLVSFIFETQGGDSQNFLSKFVRFFFVSLGHKILRL